MVDYRNWVEDDRARILDYRDPLPESTIRALARLRAAFNPERP